MERYKRLEEIDWWSQKKIRESKVMVVGAGAIGNEVLKNLALIGIGTIFVVDYDIVNLPDLTRSVLFREVDINKPKSLVAKERINEINREINVIALKENVKDIGLGIFKEVDIVLGCVDNRGARLIINENCFAMNTPYIDGGIDVLHGKVDVFLPPDSPCYECILSKEDYKYLDNKYSCLKEDKGKSVPTTPTMASIIGAYQVQEAIRLLLKKNIRKGCGFIFNALDYDFYLVEYTKKEGCIAHRQYQPIIEVNKTSNELTFGEILDLAREYFKMDSLDSILIDLDRDIVKRFYCNHCNYEEKIYKIINWQTMKTKKFCKYCNRPLKIEFSHTITKEESELTKLSLQEVNLPKLDIIPVRRNKDNSYIYFEPIADQQFFR